MGAPQIKKKIAMVDEIAYPDKAKPNMKEDLSFFNQIRNLTATNFYTTEMGWKDIGYVSNRPNKWNGVPDYVLKQYGYAYSKKEIKECVSYSLWFIDNNSWNVDGGEL